MTMELRTAANILHRKRHRGLSWSDHEASRTVSGHGLAGFVHEFTDFEAVAVAEKYMRDAALRRAIRRFENMTPEQQATWHRIDGGEPR